MNGTPEDTMPAAKRETDPDRATTAPPSVSVIIPTRDYAQYLPDAIGSVQAQTLTTWECIVVDDGSTDSTPALLARFAEADPRIRVHRQRPTGVAAARNVGLAASRGKYVQFLDADDALHPAKLADHAAALDALPDIGIVYGPVSFVSEAGGRSHRQLDDPAGGLATLSSEATGDEILDLLLVHNRFVIETPLVRRDIFAAAGTFDERLVRMEDWDLWVRIALAGTRFAFIPSAAPTVTVRVHAASASQAESEMLAAEIAVRERLHLLLVGRPAAQRLNAQGLASRRMELAVLRAFDGEVLVGLRALLPLAARSRRPQWILWALLLPIASLRGGRVLLARLWLRRRARAEVA